MAAAISACEKGQKRRVGLNKAPRVPSLYIDILAVARYKKEALLVKLKAEEH